MTLSTLHRHKVWTQHKPANGVCRGLSCCLSSHSCLSPACKYLIGLVLQRNAWESKTLKVCSSCVFHNTHTPCVYSKQKENWKKLSYEWLYMWASWILTWQRLGQLHFQLLFGWFSIVCFRAALQSFHCYLQHKQKPSLKGFNQLQLK